MAPKSWWLYAILLSVCSVMLAFPLLRLACAPTVRILRSEEHTSELQSQSNLVCRLLLEKKKKRQFDALEGPPRQADSRLLSSPLRQPASVLHPFQLSVDQTYAHPLCLPRSPHPSAARLR